jgi:hypothetical protein
MTHTRVSTIVTLVVVGGVLGWSAQVALVANGFPSFLPPVTFGVALGLVGVLLVVLAWPIHRFVVRAPQAKPVDALYATRVVLLAKAGGLTGALSGGGASGILVWVASRPVVTGQPVAIIFVSVVGAIFLTVGALIAERWCTVPPESHDSASEVGEGDIA